MIRHLASLFALVLAFCGQCAFADSSLGTGRVEAPVLVDGITAVGSAMAEVKKKPEAKPKAADASPNASGNASGDGSTGASPTGAPGGSKDSKEKLNPEKKPPRPDEEPPPPARRVSALPSRLEVVAGADRLVALSDVFKQASLSAEVRYRLSETLQLGASAGIRVQGNDFAKDVAAQLLFGPTFNFVGESGLRNAFFLSPKIGLTAQRETVNDSAIKSDVTPTLSLSFGKRFAISDTIAYAPSIGVVKEAGYSPCFVAIPLALSIFF